MKIQVIYKTRGHRAHIGPIENNLYTVDLAERLEY